MRIPVGLLLVVLSVGAARAGEPIELVLSDDGGWCWFEDERAIVHDGKLFVGTVASGHRDPARKADIEVLSYDLASGVKTRFTLHDDFQLDDHNSPALWVKPDGRLLAIYAKHGNENRFHTRVSANPGDASAWESDRTFTPSESSRVTYSNPHFLVGEDDGRGRLYNFYRGLDDSFKPSYAYSDDEGATWTSGNVFIDLPVEARHRPYVKYASDGYRTVHFFFTDGHPRNWDNSVYHAYYRNKTLFRSDGTVIGPLTKGLASPTEATRVFEGDANNVGWVSDLHLDRTGKPYGVYSVQKDSAGLGDGEAGEDHRYRYARWDGKKWHDVEIAYAGSRLYAGEDDYTGNISADPEDPNLVYISADVKPETGEPLISKADGKRHYEIFRGESADKGVTWTWTPITKDSTQDNLRPIIPMWESDKRIVLWLRGEYRAYRDYDLEVVLRIEER